MEVKRKQCEPLLDVFLLVLSSRKAEHLKDLKAILGAKTVVSQQRVGQVEFRHIIAFIVGVGKKRR